jgi:threonine/homoserine/homoserine lactone efflux protein
MVNELLLTSLITFAIVGSVTPGPNNLMVMASGAAYGWRATVPHVMGIMVGFAVMTAAMNLGLGSLLAGVPALLWVVKTAGALWLLWLAFQLGRAALRSAAGKGEARAGGRPMRFYEAVLFQWVNPKAWAVTLAAAGAYIQLAPNLLMRTAIIVLVFAVCSPIANGVWVTMGEALHRLLSGPKAGRIFGLLMAALLAATAISIFLASPEIAPPA